MNRNGLGVKALADGVDGVLKISAHLVDLIDEANSRYAILVGLPPHFFRLRLHAMHGVKDRDRAVEYAQRSLHFSSEIDVSGSINDVDADIAPGASRRGGRNGDTALLFLLHPVHRGSAFVDLSDAMGSAGIKKDALGGRGLSGINVRHDADVSAAI